MERDTENTSILCFGKNVNCIPALFQRKLRKIMNSQIYRSCLHISINWPRHIQKDLTADVGRDGRSALSSWTTKARKKVSIIYIFPPPVQNGEKLIRTENFTRTYYSLTCTDYLWDQWIREAENFVLYNPSWGGLNRRLTVVGFSLHV